MDVFKVSEKVFCGPRPTTDQMHALSQQGIRSMLSLERGWFEFFHGQTNAEFIDAMNAGIIPLHIALGDLAPPTFDELAAAHVMVIYAQEWGNVYFHCMRGKDRTGMLRAIIRVLDQDFDIDHAIRECHGLGGLRFPYSMLGWERRLREFCKGAAAQEGN